MSNFGKRTPFSDMHLKPFENVYGQDPNGQSLRKEGEYSFDAELVEISQAIENQGVDERLAHSRWRKFSRDWIYKYKGDSLNISWLKDKDYSDTDTLSQLEILMYEAKDELEAALSELDKLLTVLDGGINDKRA